MIETRSISNPRNIGGLRPGIVLVLTILAFVAGLAVAVYAVRAGWWRDKPGATMTDQSGAAARFIPAQPLGANGEPEGPSADTAALQAREATLAGQLAALEAKTAAITVEASAAGIQATRAEGLLVAFAARRAIDRGLRLGYLEEQLRARFGRAQPQAVTAIIRASRAPVTLEDLRLGLEAITPDIGAAGGRSWWESLKRELSTLVVLRQADTPSPLPSDRITRAGRLISAGQVEAARAEIVRLPGASHANNWLDAANRYIAVRRALDAIESAAILGQATQPVVQPMVPIQPDEPTTEVQSAEPAPVAANSL